MILAIIFLPVALVVITIGLPVLIFLVSVGAMCVVAYEKCFSLTQRSMPPVEVFIRRLDQTARSVTPPPELSMLPELQTSPNVSFRSEFTRTPSDVELDSLVPNCRYDDIPKQRRMVRFA